MKQSPADDSLVLFMGSHGVNWYTEDCGSTIKAFNSGKVLNEVHLHPTERSWALAATYVKEKGQIGIQKELYVTQDLGESFKFIQDHIYDIQWGYTKAAQKSEKLIDHYVKSIASKDNIKSRVFYTHKDSKTQRTFPYDTQINLHKLDFFDEQQKVLSGGNHIDISE
jgi:hypothetical protein